MINVILKPSLHSFKIRLEFTEGFQLDERDLVLTNKHIYEPWSDQVGLKVHTIYQGEYGTGRLADVMVDTIPADVIKTGCTRVITISDGTAIDIAKMLVVSDSEGVDELYDKAPNLEKKRELVIIPTTCGTGSKMANTSIMARARLDAKLGLVGPSMYVDYAVLIPELLEGLPFSVLVASSIDAPVHVVESPLPPRATSYTKLFGYKATEMIIKGYQRITAEGREALLSLLEDFPVAPNFVGITFGAIDCAAVHALSYSLGDKYHVARDESNYAAFTGVLKSYMEIKQDGETAVMNRHLADLLGCDVSIAYDELEKLLNQLLSKKALHEYGITKGDLQKFTHSVMTGQDRPMANNFIPLDKTHVLKIYTEPF